MTKSVERGRSTKFKILLMTNDPHHMYVKLVPQHSIPHYTNKVKKRVLISWVCNIYNINNIRFFIHAQVVMSGIVVDNLVPIFWLYNFDSIEFEAKEVYLK